MPSPLSVIISGCHAGVNPSPGLGIARSLRAAFPEVKLTARDVSSAASGLHDPVFDDVWLAPRWDGAVLDLLRRQLLNRLESAWFLSGLDVEIRWLAGAGNPRLLLPPAEAVAAVSKPAILAHAQLPVRLPEWVPLDEPDRLVGQFCRRHDWNVWVKGPAHEARRARSWSELQRLAADLAGAWGGDDLFIQRHAPGEELSLAYCAWRGDLLAAIMLEKLAVTGEGKVWSGRFVAVPADLRAALAAVLASLNWTGGGELEFVRDAEGELWLFDWNPRFPAWIHGATLAGHNLPAALLAAASGVSPVAAETHASTFTRVITEIPWRTGLTSSAPPLSVPEEPRSSKHPSGMPRLHRRLAASEAKPGARPAEVLAPELTTDLLEAAAALTSTPSRAILRRTATARFALVAGLRARLDVDVAYSIKTNPDANVMRLALAHGLHAEAVSQAEVNWAIDCGWPPHQIIHNGPVPLPAASDRQVWAAFADDLSGFETYLAAPPAEVLGVRVPHPLVTSRFGVGLGDPAKFGRLVVLIARVSRETPAGISFHLASSEVGTGRWRRCAGDVIDWAGSVAQLAGRSIDVLDLGGGWAPEDFDLALAADIPDLVRLARERLGSKTTIIIEPGKALAQPAVAVLTRVVHVRRVSAGVREVVVDAGINHVPLMHAFPHRIVWLRDDRAVPLAPGRDRILGPLCMEADRLADAVALPAEARIGDVLAILDCGAYDASMAYGFAQGGSGAAREP